MEENKKADAEEQAEQVEGVKEVQLSEQTEGESEAQSASCCSCDSGPEETDEQWEERTKNSPKLFLYMLLGIVVIVAVIMSIKYVYDPIPPTPTGAVISTYEPHPTTEIRDKYSYNGRKFFREGDMWFTLIEKGNTVYEVEFYYGPNELEEVPLSGEFTDVFQNDEVYVTFDPREEGNLKYLALSVGQLDTSLIKSFGKAITAGCTVNETEACADREIINCDNTKDKVVYFFKIADEPSVVMEDNCVTIQGKDWGLMRATEKFLMKAYGVI